MSANSGPSAGLMRRARDPERVYGRGILAAESRAWGPYVLLTMPEPWAAARSLLAQQPEQVVMVTTMERGAVESLSASLPPDHTIVGLGGGMAMDMAKHAAWSRDVEPILVPSIASVDACVTNSVAVREGGRVRYIGFGVARRLVIDYALVGTAPRALNRAGIGDILSIHTGCWDWRLAAQQGEVTFDEGVAQAAMALTDELAGLAPDLRDVSDAAIRWLFEAYVAENALCLQVGHSRPEEGSEHFVAYCVEHLTGRTFVHGELVCLGVLLMSRLQGNRPEWVQALLEATGVRYQPADLGLSRPVVARALAALPAYVADEGLPYSVIQQRLAGGADIGRLLEGLRFADETDDSRGP
jgi:glycerol-1-phosphate dehydrogenase [NAD(P)+]